MKHTQRLVVGRCCGCREEIEARENYIVRYPHMWHEGHHNTPLSPHVHEGNARATTTCSECGHPSLVHRGSICDLCGLGRRECDA